MAINITYNHILSYLLSLFKRQSTMNVQLSDTGKSILENKELASKILDEILKNNKELQNGDEIKISDKGEEVSILMLSAPLDEISKK